MNPDDLQPWLVPVVAALAGAFFAGTFALTWEGALPRVIKSRLELLEKVPADSFAHAELTASTARLVRYLAVNDTVFSGRDRFVRRSLWLFLLLSVFISIGLVGAMEIQDDPEWARRLVLAAGNVMFLVSGLGLLFNLCRRVWRRAAVLRDLQKELDAADAAQR